MQQRTTFRNELKGTGSELIRSPDICRRPSILLLCFFTGPLKALISQTAERSLVKCTRIPEVGSSPRKAKREIFMHPLTFAGGQKVPNVASIVDRSHL